MATGINGNEKHGKDALTAKPDGFEPVLPTSSDSPILHYEGQLAKSDILEPVSTPFSIFDDGRFIHVDRIVSDSFLLSDNYLALKQMLVDGIKVDLIYTDPPYGTGREFHSRNLEHSYKDLLNPAAYIEFLRRRFILMNELLADDGSIYVHIGPQMLSHVKVLLDEIFGANQFRNIITRRKCSSKNYTKNQYANIHDYILFYTKCNNYKWNKPGITPSTEWIDKEYPKQDSNGRYKLVPVHAPGTRQGETGKPWRGKLPPRGKHWQYTPSKLDELDRAGEIHWSKNNNPRRKVYLPKDKKRPLTDYWANYRDAHHQSIRITGYPTEKNLDMLKIIVSASSDPDDLILDPFCGSGTALQAAAELNRQFIGIDESFAAAHSTALRLNQGVRPMGDYVNNKKQQYSQDELFSNPSKIPSHLLVASWLLEAYPDDISELHSIWSE